MRALFLLLGLTAACHSPGSAPDDAGTTPDLTTVATLASPAAASSGGPVIAHPKVVAITFAGDDVAASIEAFNSAMRTSTFFAQVGAQYGVGAIEQATHVTLPDAAPAHIDDPGIQAWLSDELTATTVLGAADGATLYAIYYPLATAVTYGTAQSCAGFKGYHRQVRVGTIDVAYAVLPRCASMDASKSDLDVLTIAASHEYFEWATDPWPLTTPAWNKVDPRALPWALAFQYELADLCDGRTSYTRPADLGFAVQSMWSNAAAAAGHAPCAPAVAPVYAAYTPAVTDEIHLSPDLLAYGSPAAQTATGVIVGPGATVSVPVTLHTDVASALSFHLDATEGGAVLPAQKLQLALARTDATAGDTLQLSITAPADFAAPTLVVLYTSASKSPTSYTRWPLLVAPAAFP